MVTTKIKTFSSVKNYVRITPCEMIYIKRKLKKTCSKLALLRSTRCWKYLFSFIWQQSRKLLRVFFTDYHFLLVVQCSGYHCVRSVCIGSFSGPYFQAFGLNMERYKVSLRIQSKCGKVQTRKTLNKDTFCALIIWEY